MFSIYAGHRQDLRFDQQDSTFKPAQEVAEGPIFTCRTLDYLETQQCLAMDKSKPSEEILAVIRMSLEAIDGDAEAAARFIEHPRAFVVTPLYKAIWTEAWGN